MTFPDRDLGAFRALSRPARETLVAIHDAAGSSPYDAGFAHLAAIVRRSVRTVERNVALLIGAGFLVERRRSAGATAVLFPHPSTAAFAAAERIAPSRPRYVRRAPLGVVSTLAEDSPAMRCARVRRADGSPFLPAAYVVGLMNDDERQRCAYAASVGARLCDDDDVDARLTCYFHDLARRDAFVALERARMHFLTDARRERRDVEDAA